MQQRRLRDVVIPRSGRRGISSVGGAEPAQAYRGGGIPRYARNDSCLLPFDLRSLRALKSVDTSRSAIHRLHRLRKIPSGVLRSSDGICVNLYYKRAGSSFSRRCHSEERSDEESRLSAGQSLPKPAEGPRFLAALGMTVGRAILTFDICLLTFDLRPPRPRYVLCGLGDNEKGRVKDPPLVTRMVRS